MKKTAAIHPQTALRNIESSMHAEGFRVSSQTKAGCQEILKSGRDASKLADYHVSKALKKAR